MESEKKSATLHKQDGDSTDINEVFAQLDQGMAAHRIAASAPQPLQALPPELQRAVQVLCDTYEMLDLRVETTPATAARDFVAALPEIEDHEAELEQLVSLLIDDLRQTSGDGKMQSLLLRLAFRGVDDLARQILSLTQAAGDRP